MRARQSSWLMIRYFFASMMGGRFGEMPVACIDDRNKFARWP
jgi:hypothetical protein